ncbi:MAG: OmpP1/FadL family transporter [Fusobacteriaceae bacterium]
MKKKILLIGTVCSLNAFALGGVNTLTTPTIAGLGNPVQQAEISADSVFYNPAALGFLEDGAYISGGSGFSIPSYGVEKDNERTGESTRIKIDNLIVIPNIQYIYKKGERAYYIGLGSMGQGGLLNPSVDSNKISSVDVDYLAPGVVFGVAQKLNDKVSVSLGGRYTYVYQKVELDAKPENPLFRDIDGKTEITGGGIAPELGIYYRATEKLDLSAKYLFRTKIEQNTDSSTERVRIPGIIEEKIPKRGDYPAILSTGMSYALDNVNKFYVGYNVIFEDADYVYGGGYDENPNYKNTYEYMLGYSRKLNEKVKVEIGYTYVDKGGNDTDPVTIQELDAQVYGIALKYKPNESTEYTGVLSFNIYNDQTSGDGMITTESYRRETTIGVGVTKKLDA